MSDTRYTFGGDEHLFAELSESMSLGAFFRGILITKELCTKPARCHRDLPGQRLVSDSVRPGCPGRR